VLKRVKSRSTTSSLGKNEWVSSDNTIIFFLERIKALSEPVGSTSLDKVGRNCPSARLRISEIIRVNVVLCHIASFCEAKAMEIIVELER
jgi:hypothetical protein